MNFFTNRNTPRIGKSTAGRKVFHTFCLGGSGFIQLIALYLNLLANKTHNIEVMVYGADFDADSDSKAHAKTVTIALSRLGKKLHEQKDTSSVLGALYKAAIANDLIVNTDDYGKTALNFLLERVPEEDRPEAETALRAILPEQTLNSTLGHGGYACPGLGAISAAHHTPQLYKMVDDAVEYIKNHRDAEHALLLFAGLFGATGLSFVPILLRRIAEHKKSLDLPTYALFDAGTFYAHTSAYGNGQYRGTPEVKEKGAGIIASLEQQGLTDVLECAIAITPLRESGDPYKLCPELHMEGVQKRHTSIEPLLATKVLVDLICGNNQDNVYHSIRNSGQKVFMIQRNPECPNRPMGWDDLGLDASEYHRFLRMAAAGASMKTFILSLDDTAIQDIPALASILKHMPLTQLKDEIALFADTCSILLGHFRDICLTGTDWQQDPNNFHEDDSYRLADTDGINRILAGSQNIHFNVSSLGSYTEIIGDDSATRERGVTFKGSFNKSLKKCIDRIRADSTEDFFIQLFKLVR